MLRIGTGICDITPGRDLGLVGYELRHEHFGQRNDGVHDPLHLKVLLLLPDDAPPAVIVTIDQCLLSQALARHLAATCAGVAETTADRVLIACSHTHSGPFLQEEDYRNPFAAIMPSAYAERAPAAAAYLADLEQRLADATATALADPYPVSCRTREVPLGLGYCRRVMTATGIEYCWNPAEQTCLAPLPQLDPTLTLLQLREIDGPRQTLLWSHGCHPVVLGKGSNVVSADWPGTASALLEAHLPSTTSLFLLGAAGDTHPWIATQNDPVAVTTVGAAAAGLVELLARGGGEADRHPPLSVHATTVTIGTITVDLAAWKIGDCHLLAAPVEAFARLGLDLRAAVGAPLIFATVTGGWLSYWPDRSVWDDGGYEVVNAERFGLTCGDGERLVAALVMLAGTSAAASG